jgi:hypothetical protein
MHANIRYVVSNAEEIQQTLPGLKDISFPSTQKWSIMSNTEFLASLELSNAREITFRSADSTNLFSAAISSQLTRLDIARVSFAIESLPGGQRYSLPCLGSLLLEDVILSGPISHYFYCPKLHYIGYMTMLPGLSTTMAPIQEAFDEAFCRESPALETIFLKGVTINDAMVRIIAPLPILRTLSIDGCHPGEFIHPFLEKLEDPEYLPSLKSLFIKKSRPVRLDLSYDEFAAQCRSRRPGICVWGNDNTFLVGSRQKYSSISIITAP